MNWMKKSKGNLHPPKHPEKAPPSQLFEEQGMRTIKSACFLCAPFPSRYHLGSGPGVPSTPQLGHCVSHSFSLELSINYTLYYWAAGHLQL